jgi:antitoxin FitA
VRRVATIQIKNVPDDVHTVFKRRAVMAGQSLQEYLLGLLTDHARRPTMEELFARIDQHTGGAFTLDDVVDAIREERDEREHR